MSIEFRPLYWVYHDFWKYQSNYYDTGQNGSTITKTQQFDHFGHMHFFIPGFYTQQVNTNRAFTGTQKYNFSLKELWGSTSKDINQQINNKMIGKPKWYFYIEEYWRRIYIQDWDYKSNSDKPGFLGKKGIKYDASLPCHTKGIYRQTKDNYFFYTDLCRTLPIEYWKNENKTIRDHYLRLNNANDEYKLFYETLGSENWKKSVDEIAFPTWDFENDYPKLKDKQVVPQYDINNNLIQYSDFYDHFDQFIIPRTDIVSSIATYDPRTDPMKTTGKPPIQDYKKAYGSQSGARVSSYPDRYYIHPIIEYQKVIHKNWQRLDGWQDRDIQDEQTGQNFGDGMQYTINIPFTKQVNGSLYVQSPFSDDNGNVYPPGVYMHNVVKDQDKLKLNLTFNDSNQPLMNNYELQFRYKKPRDTWHYPMPQDLSIYDGNDILFKNWMPPQYKKYEDGTWVQQCLGAIVRAKVKVITEDNYGGRQIHWITDTAYSPSGSFVGKDQ